MSRSSFRVNPEHLLWLAILAFGLNYPILKYALSVVPATLLNAVRLTLSTGVLAGVYLYGRQPVEADWRFVRREGAGRVLLLGGVAFGLSPTLLLAGMHLTTAANAALLVASAPIWTAAVGRLAGLEHLTRTGWAGLAVSLVGVGGIVWASAARFELTDRHLLGSAILLVDAVLWGGFTALSRPLMERMSTLGMTVGCLIAGLPFLYLAAVPAVLGFSWGRISVSIWGAIVVSGVVGMGVGLVWWNGAVKHLGATVTGAYGNLVPVVAAALSVGFLGESIGPVQLVGGLCVVGGTALVRYQRTRTSSRPPGRLPG